MLTNLKIDDLIPQKHPFVLVDQLLTCDEAIIESSFLVPDIHPLVHNGKLCEGGLVENIAQTSAAGNGYEAQRKGVQPAKGFIAGIKNLIIIGLPKSGSRIFTKVYHQDRVMGYNLIKGEVFEGEKLLASCEMKVYCPD